MVAPVVALMVMCPVQHPRDHLSDFIILLLYLPIGAVAIPHPSDI